MAGCSAATIPRIEDDARRQCCSFFYPRALLYMLAPQCARIHRSDHGMHDRKHTILHTRRTRTPNGHGAVERVPSGVAGGAKPASPPHLVAVADACLSTLLKTGAVAAASSRNAARLSSCRPSISMAVNPSLRKMRTIRSSACAPRADQRVDCCAPACLLAGDGRLNSRRRAASLALREFSRGPWPGSAAPRAHSVGGMRRAGLCGGGRLRQSAPTIATESRQTTFDGDRYIYV